MEKRINVHGDAVSLLGFGCMRFPVLEKGKQDIDEAKAEKMLEAAYQAGVNYFDTAYPYHAGLSEPFMGRFLKRYPRDSFYLASKMPPWDVKTPEDVERIFHHQLQRCQTEYFDYYLVHALNVENYDICEKNHVYDTLKKYQEQGKIRRLGFSFHDKPEVLEKILKDHKWEFVQIQLNYLDWDFQDAKKQYELVQAEGIPCIVMEPVRGGTLAVLCEESEKIFKEADPQASLASWALRYAGSLPNVMTVLSGMSTQEQVQDNLNTFGSFRPLSESDNKTVARALEAYRASSTIPCTACRYCMDCPSGIDIPKLFALYNQYSIGKDMPGFVREYQKLSQTEQAQSCIACGACTRHCPQGIPIPEKMKELAALAEKTAG